MSQVEIVVTARNNATAGLNAARASMAGLSAQMRDVQRRARDLAQAERDAAEEARRLDRVVRFWGAAATEEMRDNLALAQIRLHDVRRAMSDLDDEADQVVAAMGRANMAAAAFSVHIRNADREMARLNREFNRWDRVLRRNVSHELERIGQRIDRIGDSIRQVASSALSNGLDAVGSGLQTLAKYTAAAAAAAPILAGGVIAAAGAIGDLTGIVATLPAAMLAGAASLAVFGLGLRGVGDVFEAGLSGDAEKFKESLKGLNVHAQEFVKTGVKIVEAWKPLQKVVQGHLFRGAAQALRDVNSVVQPLAEKWLPKIANLFAQAGQAVGKFFKGAGVGSQLDTIMREVWRNIDGVLKSIPYLMQAFLDIGEVGAGLFGDMGQGVGNLAKRFADWIRSLKESGELQAWVDRARDAFSTLLNIVGDLGRVIKAIFKNGADEGQTFLENIEKQTEAWADFMESADGQKFVDTLGTIGAALGNVIGLIKFLSEVWLGWVAVYESFVSFWQQGWDQMMQYAIAAMGAILDALVTLFGWIPGIGDRLKQAQADFNAWRDSSTNAINQVSNSFISGASSVNTMSNSVSRLSGAINSLQSRTVYIDVIERKTMTGTLGGGGGYRGLASGGIASGVKLVGERGPELVDFGAAGARVTNNSESRELARRSGGSGPMQVNLTVEKGPGGGDLADLVLGAIRKGAIKLKVDNGGRVAVA